MASGSARIHHWVPQCYLKGFAKSDSKNAQLFVVDGFRGTAFVASPRNVASARDFNRIDADGVAPDHVESGYAKFESLVAPALRRVREAERFVSDEDKNLILNLIALLAVRTPRMRENIRDFHERVAKMMMSQVLASKERYAATFKDAADAGYLDGSEEFSFEKMKDFVDRGEYSIELGTTRHVDHELKLSDTVLQLLGKRTWSFFKADPRTSGFITSDHPVALQWSDNRPRGTFSSPGFGLHGTEVLFPISSDLLIAGEFGGSSERFEVSEKHVAAINYSLIWHADRQVYARDNKFSYMGQGGELKRGSDLINDFPKLFK